MQTAVSTCCIAELDQLGRVRHVRELRWREVEPANDLNVLEEVDARVVVLPYSVSEGDGRCGPRLIRGRRASRPDAQQARVEIGEFGRGFTAALEPLKARQVAQQILGSVGSRPKPKLATGRAGSGGWLRHEDGRFNSLLRLPPGG